MKIRKVIIVEWMIAIMSLLALGLAVVCKKSPFLHDFGNGAAGFGLGWLVAIHYYVVRYLR